MIPPLLALLFWPVAALVLFRMLDRERALIICIIVSFLFLPSSFAIDMPAIPPLNKARIAVLSAILMLLVFDHRPNLIPRDKTVLFLLGVLMVGVLGTALTNTDPIWIGVGALQPMSSYDGISDLARMILDIMPFLLGYQYLASGQAHLKILKVIFVTGMIYSVLMLLEVRLSPQLHIWVYGYFPHIFAQQVRGDGFRPVVFMPHGLWTGFFAMTVAVAAAALWRYSAKVGAVEARLRAVYLYSSFYLVVVLVLCKSFGALLLGFILLPVTFLTNVRFHILLSVVLASIAITYPVLRGLDIVPVDAILDTVNSIDPARASSLNTRFTSERLLLERAEERPLLGWGAWGRNHLHDLRTGQKLAIADGYWVIIIGIGGWIRYLAIFGLLALPIFAVWRMARIHGYGMITFPTSVLCLLLAINMIELLPNTTQPPWTWLIAGALLGYARNVSRERKEEQHESIVIPERRTVI